MRWAIGLVHISIVNELSSTSQIFEQPSLLSILVELETTSFSKLPFVKVSGVNYTLISSENTATVGKISAQKHLAPVLAGHPTDSDLNFILTDVFGRVKAFACSHRE